MSVHDNISTVCDIAGQLQNDADDLHVNFDEGEVSEAEAAGQLRDLVKGAMQGLLDATFEALGASAAAVAVAATPQGHEEVNLEDLDDDLSEAVTQQSEEERVRILNSSQNEWFYYVMPQPDGTKKITRRRRTDAEKAEAVKNGCGVEVKY
jgi:hypothetical protein